MSCVAGPASPAPAPARWLRRVDGARRRRTRRASPCAAMFCCAKPRSPGPPRPDRQTEFLLQKHEMELERIGRLANPPFARRNGPFLVEGPGGGRTLKEKMFLQEGLLSRLEAAGWFLKGPVEALWGGERRLAKLQAASEHCTDQLTFMIEAILRAVPRGDEAVSYTHLRAPRDRG